MCNVISHIHDSSIKMEKQMKIDDLYSNLNKDINSISKRKKTNARAFEKMAFDQNAENDLSMLSGAEDYSSSVPSFESYLSESFNRTAVERDSLTPISDKNSILKLRPLFGKSENHSSLTIGCHPDFIHLEEPNSKPEYHPHHLSVNHLEYFQAVQKYSLCRKSLQRLQQKPR